MTTRGRPRTLPVSVRRLVLDLVDNAGLSFSAAARILNGLDIITPTGAGSWTHAQVARVIEQSVDMPRASRT